jgi:hypothetical protein
MVNSLIVRWLSEPHSPRDTRGAFLRGLGAHTDRQNAEATGACSRSHLLISNPQSDPQYVPTCPIAKVSGVPYWVCISLNNLKGQGVTAEVKIQRGRIVGISAT